MRKPTETETNVFLICAFAGGVIAHRVSRTLAKRDEKRQAEEQLTRNVKLAHLHEHLERVNDDLDRRIKIAKKALTDAEFNDIIDNNY